MKFSCCSLTLSINCMLGAWKSSYAVLEGRNRVNFAIDYNDVQKQFHANFLFLLNVVILIFLIISLAEIHFNLNYFLKTTPIVVWWLVNLFGVLCSVFCHAAFLLVNREAYLTQPPIIDRWQLNHWQFSNDRWQSNWV